jgi:hypothetical protein
LLTGWPHIDAPFYCFTNRRCPWFVAQVLVTHLLFEY